MKLHKGDNVIMLSGKDRGKTGKISVVLPVDQKIIVEGLNMIKKNVRARKQGQKGQIINKERAVSISIAALVCKSCGKATRIGFRVEGSNKVRICKKCKNVV